MAEMTEVLRVRSPGVTLDDVRAMVQEFIRGGPRCVAEVTDEPGAINVRCVVEDINEADLLRGQLEDYLTDHLPAGIVLNVSVLEPKAR